MTGDEEFMLSKRQYAEGRKADINEIIEYKLQWLQHGIGSNYWTVNQRNNLTFKY